MTRGLINVVCFLDANTGHPASVKQTTRKNRNDAHQPAEFLVFRIAVVVTNLNARQAPSHEAYKRSVSTSSR